MVAKLKRPRRVMMLVKAGDAVDAFIERSAAAPRRGRHHHRRRQLQLERHHPPHQGAEEAKGIRFIGTGVSGGEEGARHGPSIMPGGDPEAWPFVKDIFQAISAKVDGEACCPSPSGSATTAPATT